MTDWVAHSLGDLGRIVTGTTPPSSEPQHFTGTIPFITPSDIDGEHRSVTTERNVSGQWDKMQSRIALPLKAICVVCIGATIGKVCFTSRHSQSNQQINSIIVDETRFDPLFVYYRAKLLKEELKQRAAGAATPILNKTSFSEIQVRLPPLQSQRRISSILGAYDDLIEINRRRIARGYGAGSV
jgi:type I restriction enzyme, S subunit